LGAGLFDAGVPLLELFVTELLLGRQIFSCCNAVIKAQLRDCVGAADGISPRCQRNAGAYRAGDEIGELFHFTTSAPALQTAAS
jgi:hypothetical protein